jgi:hypothetical protein
VGGEGGGGVGKGGCGRKGEEMTQTLYAHMNKRKKRLEGEGTHLPNPRSPVV